MSKPAIHGRDHRPGGSDPLTDEWLHWGENTDTHGYGLTLTGTDDSGWIFSPNGGGIDIDQENESFPGLYGGVNWDNGFFDMDTFGGNVDFTTDGGGFTIATGDGDFNVNTGDGAAHINSNWTTVEFNITYATDDHSILIQASSGHVSIFGGSTNSAVFWLDTDLRLQGDSVVAKIADAAGSFDVSDSAGPVIFRVDNDGTVHMKTGAVLVADLP